MRYFFVSVLIFSFSNLAAQESINISEVIVENSIKTKNGELSYISETGFLPLEDSEEKSLGTIFYTAYFEKNSSQKRPITFCFNGGPGASSVFLHLGVLGPYKVLTAEPALLSRPYGYEENPYTLLSESDLVFIDPVSTGLSRTTETAESRQFHNAQEDAASIARFIRHFLSLKEKWDHPKYLIGESYGTLRAVLVATNLANKHFVELDGIVLVSSVLNMGAILDPYWASIFFYPTMAATSFYHGVSKKQENLSKTIENACAFAQTTYLQFLFEGSSLSEQKKENLYDELNTFLGLDPFWIEANHGFLPPLGYLKEVLRKKHLVISRMDSRILGTEEGKNAETIQGDPSFSNSLFGFTVAYNTYLEKKLNWKTSKEYRTLTNLFPWDYKSDNKFINVIPDLKDLLDSSPDLRVLFLEGFFDMATPFFANRYTVNQLFLNAPQKEQVFLKEYPAGHMMYLSPSIFPEFCRDLKNFYQKQDK